MSETSVPIALGLGGVAALFLISGFQGKSLGQVVSGEFGTPPNPSGENPSPSMETPPAPGAGAGNSPQNLPNSSTTGSSGPFPGKINKGPIYPTSCAYGASFPCGPNAALLFELAETAQHQFDLVIAATTNGVHAPQSWHYYGRAFDADSGGGQGRTKQSDAFAEYVKKTYGGRLLELFYMPLGIAIKNGKSIPFAASGETCTSCIHVAL